MIESLKVTLLDRVFYKRVVCIILCIVIMCFTWLSQYQEAHAILPALVIAGYAIPEGVAIVGALLAAAGITFVNEAAVQPAIDSAVNWFFDSATPAIKQAIGNMITSASNGIATVSDNVWNAARDWVQSKFQQGTATIAVDVKHVNIDGRTYPYTMNTGDATSPICPIDSLVWNGSTYTIVKTADTPTYDQYRLSKNGTATSTMITCKNNTPVYMALIGRATSDLTLYFYYTNYSTSELSRTAELYLTDSDSWPDYQSSRSASPVNVSYKGESILGQTGYDFKTAEGRRQISYPSTTADLANKTYTQIQNPSSTTVPPAAYPSIDSIVSQYPGCHYVIVQHSEGYYLYISMNPDYRIKIWSDSYSSFPYIACDNIGNSQLYGNLAMPLYYSLSTVWGYNGSPVPWGGLFTGYTVVSTNFDIVNGYDGTLYFPSGVQPTTPPTATTPPTSTTFPTTWTGTFTECSAEVAAKQWTYTGGLTGTMTGTWQGTWEKNEEGEWTFTGTCTGADSIPNTGTATESTSSPTTPDASGEINWEPLKVAGDILTKAFPFSLPWDLLRSFTSLSQEAGQPSIEIDLTGTKLLSWCKFNIDLSMFSDLLKFAKTMELLAFDVGLILLTRKLLGGAV